MEQSPLTLQSRPEVFEPKVVQLYTQLFQNPDDDDLSEGFWRELFLLRPDIPRLSQILENSSPAFLLHHNHVPQQLLLKAVATIKSGNAPSDDHALETLAVFLSIVLSKRYQSPSSDIIEVLAGLDNVDAVFTDLVTALHGVITKGRTAQVREQAVRVALTVTSGAFNTSLITYFTQKDLFTALVQLVEDAETTSQGVTPLVLIGILVNCNKFEIHSPYQSRISDLTDQQSLKELVKVVAQTCTMLRDHYVAIQNDIPEAWSVGGTLSYVGLGRLTGTVPAPAPPSEEEAKTLFSAQPQVEAAMLLTLYEFVLHNRAFASAFVGPQETPAKDITGLGELCSFASYLLQHAYRSVRSALYSHLTLLVLRILVEDKTIEKRLSETKVEVRLCRQRQPFLPAVKGPRPLTAILMDLAMDCINHNLRTKLDVSIYYSTVGILLRVVTYLTRSRTKLEYHWAELWRSMLAFARFLTQYVDQLRDAPDLHYVVHDLVNLIAICLTQGEAFLPDTGALDDLFYKLVESTNALEKFRDAYKLGDSPVSSNMSTLIGAGGHFTEALDKAGGKSKNVRPQDVMRAIKQGYDTLSIEVREGTDRWTPYREQDFKMEIKKITRVVVADAKSLGMAGAT